MDVTAHIDALQREGQLLAAVADATDLNAPIPTCPGWTMRDLLRHVGGVHRWAARNVSQPSPDPVPQDQEDALMASWPDDGGLHDWFRDGHAALAATLREAPADVAAWSFLPAPSPLAFWARRQAHETAIHRVDAESASGAMTAVPPDFGADGVDEMLLGFGARRRSLDITTPAAIALHANDSGHAWIVRIDADGFTTTREALGASADCTVRGTASDLYLLLWNRRSRHGLDATGDTTLLDLWRETMRVRWT